jgi:hypothetical protein
VKEQLYEDGADIMLMIQADMLAYHSSEEPMQLGLPDKWVSVKVCVKFLTGLRRIGSPVASQLVANLSSIYAPELTVGTTQACCSDHQSFWLYGRF